jgi:geranylgeranyl diphosphate synthase type I
MDQITLSAAGGKRLRALLINASHTAHRGTAYESATGIGAAVELFQTAALLHDDVLDDSDTRRGQPAAHRLLARLHAKNGWLGSADDFGAAAGILAGDLTLMSAHRALAVAAQGLESVTGATVQSLFADMAEMVTMGQYLDMRLAAQPLDSLPNQEEAIRTVMRTKTASYSAEFPLALGCACARGTQEDIAAVREIGVPLGVAFQLRDDVLGLTGAPEITGKPAGDDIREGKRTMLVWHAWNVTDASGRDRLRSTLGNREASDEAVAEAVATIAATDALQLVETEISSLADEATARLRERDLDAAGTQALITLFSAATQRNS